MKIFHHYRHHHHHVEFALIICAERMRNTGHREKVRIHYPSCLTKTAVQCELTGGAGRGEKVEKEKNYTSTVYLGFLKDYGAALCLYFLLILSSAI